MRRVVVDHYGGPEVLEVVEAEDPRPGPGEVCVRVLAAGVSFTDALIRAGTYLGVPKPPFTPGYELVGVVEEVGPGCTRLRVGDRIGALTVWGADAERVCVPEADAVEVPEDLDPAEVVNLVFTYMTAYQLLHRTARVSTVRRCWCTARPAGWAPRSSSSGRWPGCACTGPLGARPRRGPAARRGGDRLPQRGLPGAGARADGDGVDVVLDGFGGVLSLRSFRALRPGGRLVVYGHYSTLAHGRKSWRGWIEWYAATAAVALWGLLSPGRRVLAYRVQKVREATVFQRRRALRRRRPPQPGWFREDFRALLGLLAPARSTRSSPSACRCPTLVVRTSCWRARHPRESSCSCPSPSASITRPPGMTLGARGVLGA